MSMRGGVPNGGYDSEAVKYLKTLDSLPEKGADRLAFFAGYFEDEETVLANDAYD